MDKVRKIEEYIGLALQENVLSSIPSEKRDLYLALVENEKKHLLENIETTTSQHIDRLASIFLPTVTKLMRESFIDKLVGVQPIQDNVGVVFYADFLYSETGGGATQGESAIDRATTDYTIAPTEGMQLTRGFDVVIRMMPVQAITRKVLTKFTIEAEESAEKHNINLDRELIRLSSQKIVEEINYELLRDLYNASTQLGTWTAPPANATPQEKDRAERELYYVIEDVVMQIAERSNRIPNWIVVSPKVASILKRANIFIPRDTGVPKAISSLYYAGTLMDELQVYVVYKLGAILPSNRQNDILVGFKGNNEMEAGAFFLPYVPLKVLDRFVDPNTWTVLRSLGSSYAKVITLPQLYGKIEVQGL